MTGANICRTTSSGTFASCVVSVVPLCTVKRCCQHGKGPKCNVTSVPNITRISLTVCTLAFYNVLTSTLYVHKKKNIIMSFGCLHNS